LYDWICENRVNALYQITHMHLNSTAPKGLKITPSDKKKVAREELEKEDKRVEGKNYCRSF